MFDIVTTSVFIFNF